MTSKKWSVLLASVCLVVMLGMGPLMAGCAKPTKTATPTKGQAKKEFTFSFQLAWHSTHPEYYAYVNPSKAVKQFSKEQGFIGRMKDAASKLGYKVKFKLYPSSQMVKREESLDAVKSGTLDMLASSPAYYHGTVPEGDVDWMPYVTATVGREKAYNFFNTGDISSIIRKNYANKANAVWLTDILCGGEGIIARGNKPVKSLEDLKGMKLRCAGGVATRTGKNLGASPVTMATGEIYPALQRGVLEGLIFPLYGLKDYKFIDYCKAYTMPPLYVWTDDLWMNKDKFNSLPSDLQKAFKDTAREWGRWASTKYWPAYLKKAKKWAKDKGCNFYTLPPKEKARWRDKVKPVWDWYANESPDCAKEIKMLRSFMASQKG